MLPSGGCGIGFFTWIPLNNLFPQNFQGSEVTYDYMYTHFTSEPLECKCGSKDCRGGEISQNQFPCLHAVAFSPRWVSRRPIAVL